MTKLNGKILIVDDEKYICQMLSELMSREGLSTLMVHDGNTALKTVRSEAPDVLIVDLKMPGMSGMEVLRNVKALNEDLPVIFITGHAEIRGAVEAMKAGAHDYLAKPFSHDEVIRVVLRALNEWELKRKLKHLSNQIEQSNLGEIMGTSDVINRLFPEVYRVAKSSFSVIILGETGSGKELIARAIHQSSSRSKNAFIPVDCGAIPDPLLESELFGHEKGAFTSASTQKIGKFEAANGGTLFLDEISNLSLASQAKLLRALQEKIIYRLGGTKPVSVDVRLLAASNLDLSDLAASCSFRRDLFFRLNEFSITIPPLRKRKEDILYLAKRFLDITNLELNKRVQGVSESAIEALLAYDWPGNVRQLQSTIRRAALLADEIITEEHLDIRKMTGLAPLPKTREMSWADLPLKEIVRRSIIVVEREILHQVLRKTGGNKTKAARMLQVDYKTIHSKVKEYGIVIDEGHRSGKKKSGVGKAEAVMLQAD